MGSDYFYSPSTGLYVARQPLKIDARVAKAAAACDLKLQWDDEGRINRTTFGDALALVQRLGGTVMTLPQYWRIFNDAKETGDADMLHQLQSDHYAEWLNTIIDNKQHVMEDIQLEKRDGVYTYRGKQHSVAMPYGHPGWFNTDDIDIANGLPTKVELNREKQATSWKYWSFCDYPYTAAAIRGWVTSVGKPSLDLGIPADARQPNLMIRLCRRSLPFSAIPADIQRQARQYISDYQTYVQKDDLPGWDKQRVEFMKFMDQHGHLFRSSPELSIAGIRDKLIEALGLFSLLAAQEHDQHLTGLKEIARRAWGLAATKISDEHFTAFITSSRRRLKKAVPGNRSIVFVIGHKNPDTDTVISSLAEAYRCSLLAAAETEFIPAVQGKRMPNEITELLGSELTGSILFTDEESYKTAAASGRASWILVDHNLDPDIQKFVISIVDHHLASAVATRQEIPKTIDFIGSTCALIVQRYYGLGLALPTNFARILYGATLMDTENRSPYKMTSRDALVMNEVRRLAGITDDEKLYHQLMGALLDSDDATLLFGRDYKEDWTYFGFAVAKVKHAFAADGQLLKTELFGRLASLAQANNREKNLPLTFIKVVDYQDDHSTVNRERVYVIFQESVGLEFRDSIFRMLGEIIRSTFKGRAKVVSTDQYIEFWGVGDQLSRKRITPLLDPIASAFNRYFFSPSTGLFVKREFLQHGRRTQEAALECGLEISHDPLGRVNHLTYGEAIRLLSKLGYTAASLAEYWKILDDAIHVRDQQMVAHLQSPGFVEFLHTIFIDQRWLIDHPEITKHQTEYAYENLRVKLPYAYQGKKQRVTIPIGSPGLVSPKEMDRSYGLPQIVHSPDDYQNPALWRYWSPDAALNVATRGYIFLLGQSAIDLKVHLSESFQCLGIRPCTRNVELPQVRISSDERGVSLTIKEEGEELHLHEADIFVSDSAIGED